MTDHTFTFDQYKRFQRDPALVLKLNDLFALEPDLTAIVFVWCSASYDDQTYSSGSGWVEYHTRKTMSRSDIAARNPALAAAAWVFESQFTNPAQELLAASDGNATLLVCLPNGIFLLVQDQNSISDPDEYVDIDRLVADGILSGISIADTDAPTGHHQIEAMERFENAYPWFFCRLRELIEERTGEA